MIGNPPPYTSNSSSRLTGYAASGASETRVSATETGGATVTDVAGSSSNSGGSMTVSNLARQLSESAKRAEARDATLSHKELGQTAKALLSQVAGDSYHTNKAQNDAEVPKTNDPVLLARAKQATDFTNGSGSNPFKGMSREQLALITYDDSGSFTVNERRAALQESDDQEYAWRQKVAAKAIDEYNRTGKMTNFFTEVLEHYKALPRIEQAQYPEDYASKLQEMIDLDFNYKTHKAEGTGTGPTSLIEQLMAAGPSSREGKIAFSSS